MTNLTEAQNRGGLVVVRLAKNAAQSNSRRIPYSERYRRQSTIVESPIQYLQEAARDEAKRIAKA